MMQNNKFPIVVLFVSFVVTLLLAGALFAAENGDGFAFPDWLVTVLSAVLVPYIIQKLKKISVKRPVKFLIAVGVTVGTGLLGALAVGAYTDWVEAIKTVFIASQAAYHLFWKPLWDHWNLS